MAGSVSQPAATVVVHNDNDYEEENNKMANGYFRKKCRNKNKIINVKI